MSEWMKVAYIIEERRAIDRRFPAHISAQDHHEICVRRTIESLWEQFLYEYKWPNYCRHCDGWGITEYYMNQSPIGSGEVWNERMTEPCICLTGDEMVCPRCGTPIYDIIGSDQRLLQSQWFPFQVSEDPEFAVQRWFDEMLPCPACGWNWGKPPAQEDMAALAIADSLGVDIRRGPDALDPPWECYCWEEQYVSKVDAA